MKNILFLLLVVSLLPACNNSGTEDVVEKKFPNGQSQLVVTYVTKDGKREKIKEVTYYESGKKKDEIPYKNGKINGVWKNWGENGKLYIEGSYKNSIANGPWTYYYENGNKKSEGFAKEGKWDGKYVWYDENGNKTMEGYFSAGIWEGRFVWYDPTGKIIKEEYYHNGKVVPTQEGNTETAQ